jgi:uncharacterized OB-fold protein
MPGVSEPRVTTTKLEFPYTRTLGPVAGGFLRGLRAQRLMGIRGADGKVLVPPLEYDPTTGADLGDELVEVGPGATVVSWTWVSDPTDKHPLDHPFAFALIRPDGADSALVHAVDAGSPDVMATGMRVTPRWRSEPAGMITDIEAWEPED